MIAIYISASLLACLASYRVGWRRGDRAARRRLVPILDRRGRDLRAAEYKVARLEERSGPWV